MIKHPALRLSAIEDCDPDFLRSILMDLEQFGKLTPIAELITDFEVVGSYAMKCATLSSDIDVNVATGESFDQAKKEIFANPPAWREAVKFLKWTAEKYGVKIEPALQHPTVKDVATKTCFSLREMKTYGTELRKIERFSVGVIGEDGAAREFNPATDTAEMYDPWIQELPKWQERYGGKLLIFGETLETAWMKP